LCDGRYNIDTMNGELRNLEGIFQNLKIIKNADHILQIHLSTEYKGNSKSKGSVLFYLFYR